MSVNRMVLSHSPIINPDDLDLILQQAETRMTEDFVSSTHPPLPPTTEDERFHWLRLLRSRRVGISTFNRLMAEHGSAQRALTVLPDIAQDAGVRGYQICPENVINAELAAARRANATLICRGDAAYPIALDDLSDAPPMLWAIGDVSLLNRPILSIVGARNASSLGTRMARKLAHDLADAGFVIASGLARGVDAVAHQAALDRGTIAVQAGGVDVIYPQENAELARKVATTGLRISEQPVGTQPQARHFPVRNRIISGLSRAVIVVEAAAKSGSLITARNALDQGREVLAVPGHPFDARASGCNMLLRDGATLIRSADDVLEAVGPAITERDVDPHPNLDIAPLPEPQRDLRETAQLHQQILNRLGPSPVAEDQLIRDMHIQAKQLAPALLELELDGTVLRQPGGLLALAH